ncbi:MAG: DUF4147 domain-containing protein [Phycisphaeraceae bacterium]|nr:DUF4147 domain-containing protein [Phycisphaeraceae bacterium]
MFRAAVESAHPARLLPRAWPKRSHRARLLLALGKAGPDMAAAACRIEHFRDALVLGPSERLHAVTLPDDVRRIEVDHPLPTMRNVEAANRVAAFAGSIPFEESLVVCLSGGASAHLAWPVPGVSLHDLRTISDTLLRAGADIAELNCVRKHLEMLKGGRLAQRCTAGDICVLTLSDVEGNRQDVIASGPFSPDSTTFAHALHILERYDALLCAPDATRHLQSGVEGRHADTPKPGDAAFANVRTMIVGSNSTARIAAEERAQLHGLDLAESPLPAFLTGQARDIAGAFVTDAVRLAAEARARGRSCVLVRGGEATVHVGAARGRGGRCQELALAAATLLDGRKGITIGALATDGVDGPTSAAGAIVDGRTLSRAGDLGVDPLRALVEHDSATFFECVGGQVYTGPTGTNVNDLIVAVIAHD